MRKYKSFLIILGLFCTTLVTSSILLMGTPVSQRAVNFDRRRLNDFNEIQGSIEGYYRTNKLLPVDLKALQGAYSYITINDPETQQIYEYTPVDDTSYKLCATFSTDGTQVDDYSVRPMGYREGTIQTGYSCFTYKLPADFLSPTPVVYDYPELRPSVTILPADR